MRRMLLLLASAAMGAAFLILLSAADGAVPWIGVGMCVLSVVVGAVGGRSGSGPVARDVEARRLSLLGLLSVALAAVAGVMLAWRPTIGAGLPMAGFLSCMAMTGLLLVPAGLTAATPD